jgi:RNA polymerase sigma-70 factor (ECF subfamily)
VNEITTYNSHTDEQLITLLKEGDQDAFTELYNRYNRLLFVHAQKMLDDKEEAKDLVQELFVMLWNDRNNLNLKNNISGFLYVVIKNRILDLIAHKKVKTKYLTSIKEFIDKGVEETDHRTRINQLNEIIEHEIAFLPPKMREVFEMSRKHRLSHKKIAEVLDLSEKTVKNHINHALKILRNKLGLLLYLYFMLR